MQTTWLPIVDMSFADDGLEWQYMLGKARTEAGLVLNGIFRRRLKKTEHTLIYIKGHLHRRYIYPLIERRFFSPMVNNYNLSFVGGWFQVDQNGRWLNTNARTVERVIMGLKPMGWLGAWKKYPDKVAELCQLEKRGSVVGLATKLTETKDQLRLSVCSKGKLDNMFDLNLLRDDYIDFCNSIGNKHLNKLLIVRIREAIERTRGMCLEEFIDWNNEPEGGISYYVLTGLFLGFPHETTYSLIMG